MTTLSKSQQRIIKLAQKGGTDAELAILDEVDALEREFEAFKTENKAKNDELEVRFLSKIDELKAGLPNYEKLLESVKGKDALPPTEEQLLKLILPNIPDPIPGGDGYTPVKGKDYFDGVPGYTPIKGVDYFDGETKVVEIPANPNIVKDLVEKDLPQLGEVMRDGLELLPKGERLNAKYIDGLDEYDKRISSVESRPVSIVSAQRGAVKIYELTSLLDGSTKTFSLPAFWRVIDVKLSSIPTMSPATDYTVDGTNMQITFTSQVQASTDLAVGQTCVIIYAEP